MGDPAKDKQRVDAKLAEAQAALEHSTARAQSAAARFFDANRQLPGARSSLANARGRVAAAQVVATTTAQSAAKARAELVAAEERLAAHQAKVESARTVISGFAAEAYMGAEASNISAVLDSRSPTDLATRIAYLDTVSGEQRVALDRVTRARQAANDEKNIVTTRKNTAEAADARAKNALAGARTAEQTAVDATERVAQLVGQRRQALTVADQERSADARRTRELKAQSARIAADLRAIAERERAKRRKGGGGGGGGGGTVPQGGGFFVQPVNGWKSSDFGYRYDPYFRVWQLHAGTDYAAPAGAPIYAAGRGTVVRAGWNGGYGNYTCIYHGEVSGGRGIATCYAHQSSIGVRVGERVSRGEMIGRVGTTGASTGNHLHFEVRIDGNPVNPLSWL
ncbi:MAG TPA: peptidoglycan DD-metalloendopeptidase family protein [Mycobacteriales bacterium]|jgi:murein DD-endopeptidase MepM/ murein hydrolase activator NlpD|nr:peptidoglycan DD-metalloendopeptidase family protein [Mycobacteriales bacterium]